MMKYILVLALIVVGSFSLEGVTEINDQNFAELVQYEPSFWILLFAADWVIFILINSADIVKN